MTDRQSAAIERTPSKTEQALEAARDDPTRRELTIMVHDIQHVVEVMVDGEHENFRPTVITIGFDDSGYRATPAVLDIMRAAGWKAQDVVFSPYNRISFVEVDDDE